MTGMGGIARQDDPTLISALVCTCISDRVVVDAVPSIFANTHPNFELVVADRNKNNQTREALRPFFAVRRNVIEEIGGFDSTLCSAPNPGFHPEITVTLPYALSLHANTSMRLPGLR
jgi:hypothetical protein